MELAIKVLAYYTIVISMVFIGISIWHVGETREHGRMGAVLSFVGLGLVLIFAILVLLGGTAR